MRQGIVFEVKGRSPGSVIAYMVLGTSFLIILYYVVSSTMDSQYSVLSSIPGILLVIFMIAITVLSFYAAYVALILKRVVYDGYNLKFFRGDELKKEIPLKNIVQVQLTVHWMLKRGPVNRIFIRYDKDGKRKTYALPIDEYTLNDMKEITRQIAKYATHDEFNVDRGNKWLP